MRQIYFRNGVLFYYGNPAGYQTEGKVILDALFKKEELVHFLQEKENLEVEIREGVYDRLSEESESPIGQQQTAGLIFLRVYQLRQDSPILMRFISLAEREKRGFGRPRRQEYDLVYEAETAKPNLEEIWEQFNRSPPKSFEGHSLSISDVIEISQNGVSRYFYIDRISFIEVAFEETI